MRTNKTNRVYGLVGQARKERRAALKREREQKRRQTSSSDGEDDRPLKVVRASSSKSVVDDLLNRNVQAASEEVVSAFVQGNALFSPTTNQLMQRDAASKAALLQQRLHLDLKEKLTKPKSLSEKLCSLVDEIHRAQITQCQIEREIITTTELGSIEEYIQSLQTWLQSVKREVLDARSRLDGIRLEQASKYEKALADQNDRDDRLEDMEGVLSDAEKGTQ